MPSAISPQTLKHQDTETRRSTAILLAIAGAIALIHLLTNGHYGFHRDELQTLSDALHMDWGFVAYPPFTPFVERIGMSLFGISVNGMRVFSVIAQAIVIIISGLMARELGGKRLAQAAAALSAALAPLALFEGTEFQYSSFDYLWWVLIAYFTIRLLKSENPRWCLAIGATLGLGLMTKYSIAFFLAGIVGGLVLTRARRFLTTGWFWGGVALAFVICLPNVIWQLRHGLISLHFLQYIHARDVGEGRAQGFFSRQFWVCSNLVAVPLWIAGLIGYFRSPRFRMLAWMYAIPLLLFAVAKGRDYYVGAAYPMLLALGAVMGERWVDSLSALWRRTVEGAYFTLLVASGVLFMFIVIPFASSGPVRSFALKNNGDLREEIGWHDLVHAVAGVRDALPPDKRQDYGVLVGNYGEQGAIEVFGPAYHLPRPISLTNSAWLRGYPTPPPTTLIVVGFSKDDVDEMFTGCQLAGHNGNSEGVKNEESKYHPDIFVCGSPRLPWPEFWKKYQAFG